MLPQSFKYDPGGFFFWSLATDEGFDGQLFLDFLPQVTNIDPSKTCPEKTQGRYFGSHTPLRLPFEKAANPHLVFPCYDHSTIMDQVIYTRTYTISVQNDVCIYNNSPKKTRLFDIRVQKTVLVESHC